MSFLNKRLNRESYILYCGFVFPLLIGCSSLNSALQELKNYYDIINIININLCMALIFFIAIFILTIKRLHDINRSGFYSLLLIIPLVILIMPLYLAAKKGSLGINKYGDEVCNENATYLEKIKRGSFSFKILLLFIIIIFLSFVFGVSSSSIDSIDAIISFSYVNAICFAFINYFFLLYVIQRLNDMQKDVSSAIFAIIPLVNLCFTIYLCFAKSKDDYRHMVRDRDFEESNKEDATF